MGRFPPQEHVSSRTHFPLTWCLSTLALTAGLAGCAAGPTPSEAQGNTMGIPGVVPPAHPSHGAAPSADRQATLPASWQLAQATQPAAAASLPTLIAPPPRFGNMQTQELPPLPPSAPAPRAQAPAAPAPTATPAAAPKNTSTSSDVQGFWLQLGAFREATGAQALLDRTARDLPALGPQMRVFSETGTHRLQAGPYPSREVAQELGAQLRNGLGLTPIVVERR